MQQCTMCHGRKRISGMGGMPEDCGMCGGKGVIEEIEVISKPYIRPYEFHNTYEAETITTDNSAVDFNSGSPIYQAMPGETVVMAELPDGTIVDASKGNCTIIGETTEALKPKTKAKSKAKAKKK